MQNERNRGLFDISQQELFDLFRPGANPEGLTKTILMFVSLILSPITLIGALIFYKRGYRRFMQGEFPRLNNLPPIVRVGMIIGAILIWVGIYFTVRVMTSLILWLGGNTVKHHPSYVFMFLGVNILITVVVFVWFSKWRGGIMNYLSEKTRHGSARFAKAEELLPYRKAKGFYIGKDTFYRKAGHMLTVAGTRSGKGVNLILQNLLMPHLFKGSWVIIDPKGELAAISANVQRKAGRRVVILNPWNLLGLYSTGYNPLDLLKNDKLNLSDDVQMLAESLVPSTTGKEDDHWSQRARTFISGLLLHLVTEAPAEDRHLGTLWQWLRLDDKKWLSLLIDMQFNQDPNSGEIVRATANEIINLMKMSEKEYASVMSTAQKFTDFIKSPALRESMKTSLDFTSDDLASGNVTVYVCIPFDKIISQKTWLRLVITSLMRSVVRNPKKDVCFLIDEAYTFGYHSEIEMALGAYAGFGIHVWSVFQSLSQIHQIYNDNWENFIANCSVRHFFNISENFGADYISKMFGNKSVPEYDDKGQIKGASARALINPDELRTNSGKTIYTVIDQLHPVEIPKQPYFEMNLPCDPNPYYKGEDNENEDVPRQPYYQPNDPNAVDKENEEKTEEEFSWITPPPILPPPSSSSYPPLT